MKFLDPKEKQIDYSVFDLWKDLWRYGKPYRRGLIVGTVLRVIGDLASLYRPVAFALLVNELIHPSTQVALHICLIIVSWLAAILVRYIFLYQAKKIIYYIGLLLMTDSEKHMVEIMFAMDSAWHEKESSGVKAKRIDKGAAAYNDIVRAWVNYYVSIIINFIAIPFIFFKLDHTTSVLIIIFLISYFILSKRLQKKPILAHYGYNIEDEKVSGLITEAIGNIRTVRLLGLAGEIEKRLTMLYREMLAWGKKRLTGFQFRSHFLAIYTESWRLIILSVVSYGILKGHYEVGFIILFSNYFSDTATAIQELADVSVRTWLLLNSQLRVCTHSSAEKFQKKQVSLFFLKTGIRSKLKIFLLPMEIKMHSIVFLSLLKKEIALVLSDFQVRVNRRCLNCS
jgi:ABC-type multidrug transport system fused ATPase/permease subunit